MKRFKLSTEVLFSEDAIDALLEEKDENAVLITDKFMVDSGMADIILKKLSNCKEVSVFSEVVPDPPMDLIERGIAFLQDKDCDVVVALGGGSSIDAAKAIVYMAKKIDEKQNPDNQKKIKLIALPTTSGTGSEVTQFAVVTDSKTGVKIPLIDESLMPDIAILDPELVKSAPPFITADTGMDVITHALEAYVSETASDCSDCLAEKAAELAFEFLPGAIFHIPHGRANALVLPYVIEFNADMAREGAKHSNDAAKKYQKMARIVGLPAPTPKVGVANLIAEIQRLLKYMDRPQCMSECGVSVEEFNKHREEIVRRALADACTQANPRKVTAEDINKILDHIAK